MQTLGEPNVPGTDDKHFYRPTFMAWLPDGTFFVADGYANTRVVKFDKDGKFLMTWGEKGNAGKETRPGFFNNVHGVAVDPQTRRVFVNDRANGRVQVFDENGKYLNEWKYGPRPPSDVHLFIISGDRYLWAFDRGTSKMLKYDLDGKFLLLVGHLGRFPWRVLGRARHGRRPGGQFLHGRGGYRRRAEVPSASGREPGVPHRQARVFGVDPLTRSLA